VGTTVIIRRDRETTRPPHLALFVGRYNSVWETVKTDRLSNNNNNNNRNMRILAARGQDPVLIRSFSIVSLVSLFLMTTHFRYIINYNNIINPSSLATAVEQ